MILKGLFILHTSSCCYLKPVKVSNAIAPMLGRVFLAKKDFVGEAELVKNLAADPLKDC